MLAGEERESIVGYSRAIRVGNQVWVSGTTATNERGAVLGVGDAYAQTIQALKNVESALGKGLNLFDALYNHFVAKPKGCSGWAQRPVPAG